MIKSSRIRWALLVAIVMAALVLLWRIREGSGGPIQAHLLKKSDLTPAEIRYGRAPQRDSRVVYQPDVIIVGGGADVIRTEGPDPLTWTIDARARHASSLEVGKIAFVTGRCVGRVLMVKRNGANLTLILGPVDLTEIYRKLDVTINQPLDLTQAIEDAGPQFPGLKFPVEGQDAALPRLASTSRMPNVGPENGWLPESRAPLHNAQYELLPIQDHPGAAGILPLPPPVQFQVKKRLNRADGVGMEFGHDGSGAIIRAQVQFGLKKPSLDVYISIDNGKVQGRVILHNAASLLMAFDSAVGQDFAGNVTWYSPGGGISFPIGGPVPLAFDVRHDFWVETAFAGRQSSFSAGGEYEINADLGFAFTGKTFIPYGPQGLVVRKDMFKNLTGASIGPRGLLLKHQVTITAGVGGLGFTAGPQFVILTSLGTAKGSDIGIVPCKTVNLAMDLQGGVGWTIPEPITIFVNAFLRLVNVKPIQSHGGFHPPAKRLFTQRTWTESGICGQPEQF
jgi:hypothetical protein